MDKIQEWCSTEGVVKNHRIIRRLRSGSKTESFLATTNDGNKVVLTYLDSDKIFERLKFAAHQSGLSLDEAENDASKKSAKIQEEFRELCLRIKGLGSEHVAALLDIGLDREKKMLVAVSEYTPGVDIFYATRGLTPTQMISLFSQAVDGLGFIHKQGFLHLNVKPSRVKVDIEGEEPRVVLVDFGFAIPRAGYSGEFGGTALYMAPEVISESRNSIDTRADLYSFGVLAYYCLTEKHPTEHRLEAGRDRKRLLDLVNREDIFSPPSHINGETPHALDEIILGLIEKNPDNRKYRSAADLQNAFFEHWPEESRKMPHEETSTLFEYD